MAKVKVKVLNAYVDGKGPGEELSMDNRSADHLESIGYVEKIVTPPPVPRSKKGKAKETEEE